MNCIKTALATIWAWIMLSLGIYAPWVGFVLFAIAMDYLTGMLAAAYLGILSSKVGFRGIIKKVAYLLLMALGFVVDWLVQAGAGYFGWTAYPVGIIALAVMAWIIINEAISILENLGRMDVRIPGFFKRIIKSLHGAIDNADELVSGKEEGDTNG